MSCSKPYAPAAERNQQAILLALSQILRADDIVFEFGSGTGQHACHICTAMPQLTWQPSDINEKLPGIEQWIAESGCRNVMPPMKVDLSETPVLTDCASVCYSANTLHIISWRLVENLFRLSAAILQSGGTLCVYGPFSFDGQHTSMSNQQFDQHLRHSDSRSGVRDVADLNNLAQINGFSKAQVTPMPANNFLLTWKLVTQD